MTNILAQNAVALESSVAALPVPADKPARGPRPVDDNVSEIALGDAVKAAKGVDKLSWNFSASVLAMKLEGLARAMKRGDNFQPNKDPRKVPGKVSEIASQVQYTLEAKAVHAGIVVYIGTEAGVAEIATMPNGTKEQKAARKSAALLVADASWFHEGKPVSKNINPAKDTSGKYIGAIQKARTNAFRAAKETSDFMLGHIFMNDPDFVRRSFVPAGNDAPIAFGREQIDMVRAYVADTYGATFAEVEAARRAGRPPAKPKSDKVDSLFKSAAALTLDELLKLTTMLQQRCGELAATARDADEVSGDWDVPALDTESDDAAPARTGTEG
ncbi:hypothetical protein [Methylobacterium indicum]|uniref:Uncharacterized protein n=1 Tax=Methylobacterium indicum TaxID=1775910 RepID=A0A8H8X0V2_9HYPH|nr:hypothetical protein [Methylobacterium indicum]BCM87763.1 hypothetical protein mvi_62240 [Methylobacterium indicum]